MSYVQTEYCQFCDALASKKEALAHSGTKRGASMTHTARKQQLTDLAWTLVEIMSECRPAEAVPRMVHRMLAVLSELPPEEKTCETCAHKSTAIMEHCRICSFNLPPPYPEHDTRDQWQPKPPATEQAPKRMKDSIR